MSDIWAIIKNATGIVRARSSAMHSLLWCICILLAFLAALSYVGANGIAVWVVSIALGAVVVLFTVAYVYFMLTDPDRLHSEGFQLRKHELKIEAKGSKSLPEGPIVMLPPERQPQIEGESDAN